MSNPREDIASPSPAERLERLRRMLEQDPDNKGLQQRYVETALSLGQPESAVQIVEAALRKNPGDAAAQFNLSNVLIARRDYRGALDALARVRAAGGNDPAIELNAGLCHYCVGEYEQARSLLKTSYDNGMRSSGLLRMLVSSLHHLGQMDEALRLTRENAAAGLEDAALAGVYALLYLDADDVAGAARWARAALDKNPGSVDGRITQATLLTARMQTDAARAMLEGLLSEHPQTARAWIGLGTLDLLNQDMQNAKMRLSRGVELMPQHVGSWHTLAWAQLLTGELDRAEASLNRSMELDRNFAETHGGLASVAALRGDEAAARRSIEIAKRLDPECLSARFAESVLHRKAGQSDRADALMQEAIALLAGRDGSALSRMLTKVGKR